MRFRHGVFVARAGDQLVLDFRGEVVHRGSADDVVMRLAVGLLGGLERPILEEATTTPAAAAALSVWRTRDLIQEYDDVGQLESASRLEEMFHRRGWSGAISLLESVRSESLLAAYVGSGETTGPSIPVRASTETPAPGPAAAVERALHGFSGGWSTRILSVVSDAGVLGIDHDTDSISSIDVRGWFPVLSRSGLRIGHVVLLANDGAIRSPRDFVHRELTAGLLVREIEARLESDGFGYLAHTWLSAEARSRFGPAHITAAIAVEKADGHPS